MLKLCHHKTGCREAPNGCEACFRCEDITMYGLVRAGLTPREQGKANELRYGLWRERGAIGFDDALTTLRSNS